MEGRQPVASNRTGDSGKPGASVADPGIKDGEKMYHAGSPIAWFGRWKIVPPVAFHRSDIQPVEGVMDVSRGDLFAGTPGLPGWRG